MTMFAKRIGTALFAGAALLAAALVAPPADARDLTSDERAALSSRIAEFDAAMAAEDFAALQDFTPPRVTAHIAQNAGVTTEQLREVVASTMAEAMQTVEIESFGMNLDAAEVDETGAGGTYLLIPSETIMDVEGSGRLRSQESTLAFMDEGAWYLMRVSDVRQVMILREVYPEFQGVTFPKGSMEALE